jgi:hypothetical protein
MNSLERITERVNRLGDVNDPATPQPLVTLAEFFEGKNAVGSIGCNLVPTPTPAEFYEELKRIEERSDVCAVRVQVTMFDHPEWPFSDVVWVITSAKPQEVIKWFDDAMRPDECCVGWPEQQPMEPCPVPVGMTPIGCWWD